MKRFPSLFATFAAASTFAAVPHVFTAGQAAKASDINENFTSLDSAVGKKADQSSVDQLTTAMVSKADSNLIATLLSAKADTSRVGVLERTLTNKQNALGFSPLNKAGDAMSGKLVVGGGVYATPPTDSSLGAIYGSQVATQNASNLSFGWKRDGSTSWMQALNRSISVQSGGLAPVYFDGTSNRSIWHAGNLDPASYLTRAGNRGMSAFTDNDPPHGSWYADPGYPRFPDAAPTQSYHYEVFSTGNSRRGLQIACSWLDDILFFRRGADTWQNWVMLANNQNFHAMMQENGAIFNTGGTITGDLRVAGKLTTSPGITPADYVFEPDFRLAPLSEVESYTLANKHLPEMPSAAEMTSDGVDIAKMNMLLLKKVEELTLHAIAQQKEIDAQKARIDNLEARTPR